MVKDLEIISTGKLLHVKAGCESASDPLYAAFFVAVDRQVREHGSVRVLLESYHSGLWSAMAWWQDANLDFKVTHIDPTKLEEAKRWLAESS